MKKDRVTATEIIVIRMYIEDNKSYRDIAEELNIDYFEVSKILSSFSSLKDKPF